MKVTFVTGNKGKVAELQAMLAPLGWEVVQDLRGYPEIQAPILADVTEYGADHLLASGLQPPFLLEDSGLFVDALKGFPGVFSRHALDTLGCEGILRLMEGVPETNRTATFATDLLFVERTRRRHFEGVCHGRVALEASGTGGFGFDPVFIPAARTRTFAEMSMEEKSRVSHRGQAVRLLLSAINQTAKP